VAGSLRGSPAQYGRFLQDRFEAKFAAMLSVRVRHDPGDWLICDFLANIAPLPGWRLVMMMGAHVRPDRVAGDATLRASSAVVRVVSNRSRAIRDRRGAGVAPP